MWLDIGFKPVNKHELIKKLIFLTNVIDEHLIYLKCNMLLIVTPWLSFFLKASIKSANISFPGWLKNRSICNIRYDNII